MELPRSTEPDSPLQIPPAEPIRKKRLWSQGESAAVSSKESLLESWNDKYSSYGESKTKEGSLSLSNLADAPLAASLSSATTLHHRSYVLQPFWTQDNTSPSFHPEEYEKEDSYYTPPPQFFSLPVSPIEGGVEENISSLGPSAIPEVSITYHTDLLQLPLT